MHLTTSRPLVVGVLDVDDPETATRLMAEGADIVEVPGAPPPDSVVAADLKDAARLVASHGSEKPVLLTADDLPTIAVAVVIGCHLIRTTPAHVRAARRVCDVVAAVREAGA